MLHALSAAGLKSVLKEMKAEEEEATKREKCDQAREMRPSGGVGSVEGEEDEVQCRKRGEDK